MSRKALCLALALVLFLAAGCVEKPPLAPTATSTAYPPRQPTVPTWPPTVPVSTVIPDRSLTATAAAYPWPPTAPTVPTPLPPTPEPTATPEPSPDLAPKLVVQPVPEELRAVERIAFLRDGDLWLVRPDGSALTQVSTSGNVSTIFGWSWDNSYLLLGITSNETGRQGAYPWVDLWSLQANTSSAQQMTQGQTIAFASWSPVGPSFAYATLEGRLYVMNMEKGETLPLEQARAGLQESAWSPDGTRLAIVLLPLDWEPGEFAESTDIAVWNLSDGTITNLTNTNDDPSRIMNYYPIWSMNGSKILFHSEREPLGEYRFWYIMDSDGSNLQHLDTPPLLVGLAVIRSPVADRVVVNVGGDVWLLDFNGRMRKIGTTTWPCCAYPPYSWSPDGTQLALVEAGGKLVRLDLRSLAVATITATASNPAWTH